MSLDLIVKHGDTRTWSFTLSDADNTALSLSGATVEFMVRSREGGSTAYFDRDTSTDDTDLIKISDATNGVVVVYPTASDWTDVTDYGCYVGEFRVTSSAGVLQYTEDVTVDVQQGIVE